MDGRTVRHARKKSRNRRVCKVIQQFSAWMASEKAPVYPLARWKTWKVYKRACAPAFRIPPLPSPPSPRRRALRRTRRCTTACGGAAVARGRPLRPPPRPRRQRCCVTARPPTARAMGAAIDKASSRRACGARGLRGDEAALALARLFVDGCGVPTAPGTSTSCSCGCRRRRPTGGALAASWRQRIGLDLPWADQLVRRRAGVEADKP